MVDLSRWPQADDVLDEALARPRGERAAVVRAASGGDTAFEAALLAVLAEADTTDDFLTPGGALRGALASDLAGAPPATSPTPRLPIGTRFGAYEIVELAGAGGMGEVYRGRDPRLGRDVAIKVLPAQLATDPGRHERLQRFHASEQANEIILATEREHSVDQIVTDTCFTLLDLEAVSKEVE